MKKLKREGIIKSASQHNLRDNHAQLDRIDPTRTAQNVVLAGPSDAEGVNRRANALMAEAGVRKLRVDAVRALELLFSLPAGHAGASGGFFPACLQWARDKYGSEQILSAVVHLDERAPHMHVLVLPLCEGKMNGSRLMGNAAQLRAAHRAFHQQVGKRYGLRPPLGRLSAADRDRAFQMVLDELERRQDPLLRSPLRPQLIHWIRQAPELCFPTLGIELAPKAKKLRTMEKIFTSKGRGPKFEDPTK
ncbi:plasmid recombination protein [Acidovorax sp. sic0104]|nr:plasmid recombination protein [Acidovorax sp. sic0104]